MILEVDRRPKWRPQPGALPARVMEALADGELHRVEDLAQRLGVARVEVTNALVTPRTRGIVRATLIKSGATRTIVGFRLVRP